MRTLQEIKIQTVMSRLRVFQGNRVKTAESLGISLRGLRNWINLLRKQGHVIPPILPRQDQKVR